ncbi:MAG: cupin domain-containing protein [Candidatus Omnitrophota bacterium]|jgi:cupin 2 domain-containing protein
MKKEEIVSCLFEKNGLRIERIISEGQLTPAGEWLVQKSLEWVMVLSGSARLLLAGEKRARLLRPGDHVLIPAGKRHRVTWTDTKGKTVWLAVHYRPIKK